MKVTQVSIRPTELALKAERPVLTPELLAATGARYSRSNEGLEAILARIDPQDLDASVDSIFRMIDYGHQSIADMAPVAMFIDGVSIWMAYYLWTLAPTAGGQESSTRYIKLDLSGLVSPEELGIPSPLRASWQSSMDAAFNAYSAALDFWTDVASSSPGVLRIPHHLLSDTSEPGQRKVARMRRNYAFDRARYFLPVAARTNLMLIMSARAWVQICQQLLSHPLLEPRRLGKALSAELQFAAPRLLKHAEKKPSFVDGLRREFVELAASARSRTPTQLSSSADTTEMEPHPTLTISAPPNSRAAAANDLEFHDNRYAWIGPTLRRTSVRFGWDAVALAEIRDLNRHRTGSKHCPLVPLGFYYASDQLPTGIDSRESLDSRLKQMAWTGRDLSALAHSLLAEGEPSYVYYTGLGTQYYFEHVTTADKFIYEAELRTGIGSHFRYAKHLRDVLALWYEAYPETQGLIIEGSAEPE